MKEYTIKEALYAMAWTLFAIISSVLIIACWMCRAIKPRDKQLKVMTDDFTEAWIGMFGDSL